MARSKKSQQKQQSSKKAKITSKPKLSKEQKQIKKSLVRAVTDDKEKAASTNGGKIEYGWLTKKIEQDPDGLYSRYNITPTDIQNEEKRRRKMTAEEETENEEESTNLQATNQQPPPATPQAVVVPSTNNGGRPKGSTKAAKRKKQISLEDATTECAKRYKAAQDDASNQQKKLAPGTLNRIITEVTTKYNLVNNNIKSSTIIGRVSRAKKSGNNSCLEAANNQSPVPKEIEALMVGIVISASRVNITVSKQEFLSIINDLLTDSQVAENILEFKHNTSLDLDSTNWQLKEKYYKGFMKRWGDFIKTKGARRRDENRETWLHYNNFEMMYKELETMLLDSGVARNVDPYMVDSKGELTADPSVAVGEKVQVELTHPELVLVFDKQGTNTNQKIFGQSNQRFVGVIGQDVKQLITIADFRYTKLGVTALDGTPVLCVVIMTSDRQGGAVPIQWLCGVDLYQIYDDFKNLTSDDIKAKIDEWRQQNPIDLFQDQIQANANGGTYFSGGPICQWNNHQIPCLVCTSESGGITPAILTTIFKTLEQYLPPDIRTVDGPIPCAICDGHGSRFNLDFLRYINDPNHRWNVMLGVPNCTDKWQVGDSSEQNGSDKMATQALLAELATIKRHFNLPMAGSRTDIMPTVKRSWARSFARVNKNKKAIRDRGFNPLNRILLHDPDIMKTKPLSSLSDTPVANPLSRAVTPPTEDEAPPLATPARASRHFEEPSPITAAIASGVASHDVFSKLGITRHTEAGALAGQMLANVHKEHKVSGAREENLARQSAGRQGITEIQGKLHGLTAGRAYKDDTLGARLGPNVLAHVEEFEQQKQDKQARSVAFQKKQLKKDVTAVKEARAKSIDNWSNNDYKVERNIK